MNWFDILQAGGRGLYNQFQNDSRREEGRGFGGSTSGERDRQFENELIEGEDGEELRRCFKEGLKGNWTPMKMCVQELMGKGYSKQRIDAMLGTYTRMKVQ